MKHTVYQWLKHQTSFVFSVPALMWQLLFLYIPLLLVVYASVKSSDVSSWFDLTLNNFFALADYHYFTIIGRSVFIAAGVAFLCLVIGYPVAYFLALRIKSHWKNVLLFLLTLPFWTNFLIQVYAWVFVLDHNGLINSFLLALGFINEPLHMVNSTYSIFLVMIHYYLPFMIMPLYTILEKIQPELLEASMDLGATNWQTFRQVTLPLSMSGIKTGVLLVFVPAFGEFVIPSLIGGAKYMFVGSLISHYFLIVRDSQIGSAFTVLSGLVLIVCVMVFSWVCDMSYSHYRKNTE